MSSSSKDTKETIAVEEPKFNADPTDSKSSAFSTFPKPNTTPDGGLTAWLQVLGCWLLFMNTWGLTNSYGVFETYYINTLLPNSSPSAIAWIGSIQVFLTSFVGAFAGWLLDAGQGRLVLVGGLLFEVFGMFMTSLCSRYWEILLAQGICVGMGTGLLGLLSVSTLPAYFVKRRMVATGVAATGSSIAGAVYPILLRRLIDKIGFPWAVRVLAFVISGLSAITLVVLRPQSSKKAYRKLFKRSMFQDYSYTAFVVAFVCISTSLFVPYFFLGDYGLKLGVSSDMAFYLFSIMNATSLFGRLTLNTIAQKAGGLSTMAVSLFFGAVILFLFRLVHDLGGIVVIAAVYGFVSGGILSIAPVILADLTPDLAQLGTRIGMAYSIGALGTLVGNPIAGAAQRPSGPSVGEVQVQYQGSWLFAACFMLIGSIATLFSWMYKAKR